MKFYFFLFTLASILSVPIHAQERTKLYNEVIFGLNGAGDQFGYIVSLGVAKKITRRNDLSLLLHFGRFKGTKYQIIEYGEFKSDEVFGFSATLNHKFNIGKRSSFKPETGVILRNHHWTISTKGSFIEIGPRYTPPYSQAIWNDRTIGYTIALPFVWQVTSKADMSLGPVYQNDTFGYSVFGGQIRLYVGL